MLLFLDVLDNSVRKPREFKPRMDAFTEFDDDKGLLASLATSKLSRMWWWAKLLISIFDFFQAGTLPVCNQPSVRLSSILLLYCAHRSTRTVRSSCVRLAALFRFGFSAIVRIIYFIAMGMVSAYHVTQLTNHSRNSLTRSIKSAFK